MTQQDVLGIIENVFCDVLDNQSIEVSAADSQDTIEGWDSLAHINIIAAIEDEFGFEFAVSEISATRSIQGLVEAVCRHLGI